VLVGEGEAERVGGNWAEDGGNGCAGGGHGCGGLTAGW
jgi:hypothetical protein